MSNSSKILGASMSLILHAKYQDDETSKNLAGTEAVAQCIKSGDHMALVSVFLDEEFTSLVKTEARKGMLPAAIVRCKITENEEPIYDLITHESLPINYRKDIAQFMQQCYLSENNLEGMLRLCKTKGCPYEERQSSGEVLLNLAKEELKFSLLLELATTPDVVFEVRKPAGLILIELAVEHGNFPILQRMGESKLTTDVHIELDGKADMAALNAIQIAIGARDLEMLESIANMTDLAECVKLTANKNLRTLQPKNDDLPSKEGLDRAFIERLKRNGDLVVKTDPPPSSKPKLRN